MNRRNFLKTLGIGTVVAAVPVIVLANTKPKAVYGIIQPITLKKRCEFDEQGVFFLSKQVPLYHTDYYKDVFKQCGEDTSLFEFLKKINCV